MLFLLLSVIILFCIVYKRVINTICVNNEFKFIFCWSKRQLIWRLHARCLEKVAVPIINGNIFQMDITYIYMIWKMFYIKFKIYLPIIRFRKLIIIMYKFTIELWSCVFATPWCCGEFRWSPEGPISQIQSPHLQADAPWIFSDLLRSVQILKREWGAERNGKLPYLFIPSKTATLVPEFAVEDLPLGRTAALMPELAVKGLSLSRTLWWWQ